MLLARTLVQDAELVLLDEPMTGVDVATAGLFLETLGMLRTQGRSVVISTHDLGWAAQNCDLICLLAGTVHAFGPPADTLTAEALADVYGATTIEVGGSPDPRPGGTPPLMGHYLLDPLQFEFMRRALAAVVLTGVVSGVLGSYVVLRGMAFIGDALSHAVFPGIVIAVALGRSILLGAMVVGLLTACGIALISRSRRVSEDTAIGILFAGMFALGVVLVSSLASYQKDIADLLFGSILGVSTSDLELAGAATAVVLVTVLLLNKEFSLIAFDREMADAMRYPVFALDLLLLALITLAIVVSLRAIGNILVLAMLVTPAATARLLTNRLLVMQALAAAIGAACGVAGLYISFWWDLASGGTIVVTATLVFFVVFTAVELGPRLRPRAGLQSG